MLLQMKSVYALEFLAEAAICYKRKITVTGLQIDSYLIENNDWTREPEMIPRLMWTDLNCLYMISTPSE